MAKISCVVYLKSSGQILVHFNKPFKDLKAISRRLNEVLKCKNYFNQYSNKINNLKELGHSSFVQSTYSGAELCLSAIRAEDYQAVLNEVSLALNHFEVIFCVFDQRLN